MGQAEAVGDVSDDAAVVGEVSEVSDIMLVIVSVSIST